MSFNPFDETNKKVFECVLSALAFFCGNKSGKNSNILLVEGSTDKKFFENRLADGVEIYSFEELSSYDSFLELNKYNYKPNFKRSIINIIQRTKDNMTEFCKNPEDAKNYNFYGIVDLDTDNFRDFDTYHNLFITDEHDLETTIIANDNNVISKLDGNYTEEDLNKALYTAHQYEFIRNEIKNIVDEKNISLSFGSLENKNGEINFSDFFTDRKINYKEYLHSIKAKMDAANVLDSNNPVLKDTSIEKF